jgi:hypothetical protein
VMQHVMKAYEGVDMMSHGFFFRFFSFFFYHFPVKPSGLFPNRINMEVWTLQRVGRIPWTGDQPCRKAATYTGQHKHRKKADRHPYPSHCILLLVWRRP